MQAIWQDKNRRRAALLSFIVHALILWLFIATYRAPQVEPQESFIVIDIGTPQQADTVTQAPTATAAAPQAAVPEVADTETGVPSETPAVAETQPLEAPPEVPAPTPEPVAETPPTTLETQQPVAETPLETPAETSQPITTPDPVTETPAPPEAAPAVAEPVDTVPVDDVATTALPEVATPVVPDDLPETRSLPIPEVSSQVTTARAISLTPTVEVTQESAIPTPQPSVDIAERSVPTPQASVAVQAAVPVPVPSSSVTVTPQQLVPEPAAVSEVVPEPTQATNQSNDVSDSSDSSQPATTASTNPDGAVAAVPTRPTPSNVESGLPQGGSSDASGQTSAVPDANVDNTGLATNPDGGEGTGSPAPASFEPFRDVRQRPLSVILDNVFGYPQTGLLEASAVYELPVEGGVTRLMASFDRVDPARVGPIRSARDYFVSLAQSKQGILVHAGGSPGALQAIAMTDTPTLDALSEDGGLFARSGGQAPYNLYSQGNALRNAINRLNLAQNREIRSSLYRPAEDAEPASGFQASYGAIYETGFRYIPEINQYRWQRAGTDAVDASGQAILVDVVLVARITAAPYPNDPEGRLYIPLSGGEATLYVRGTRVPGQWSLNNGVTFTSIAGDTIDLTPFKHWVVFAPTYSRIGVAN